MIAENHRAALYCSALDEIRARLTVVRRVCRQDVTLGAEQFDYEIVAVNLRKILEHVAFGTLTANQSAYEAAHNDVQRVWRAKQLLERLEKIHKDFFPHPLAAPLIRYEHGRRHLHFDDLASGFLTRAEFVELYDACSQVIHSKNPFSGATGINFIRHPLEWADRINQLLAFHRFRLAGFPQLWMGELEGPDGKAHVSIASPT